jgi:hypothetical protein
MGKAILKYSNHHVSIEVSLDLDVVGDAVDPEKDIAGAGTKILVHGFGTQVFDRAVQGVFCVEKAVDKGDDRPIREMKELFEGSVENVPCLTLWILGTRR